MTYTAIFRDGPLGGQTMQVPRPDHTFRVQPPPRIGAAFYAATDALDLPEPESYELVGGAGSYLEYRWVNPADGLRREVERLRAQIEDAREALS